MTINILQLLEGTVKRCPDKIALSDDKRSLTFSQWQAQAQSIGTHLTERLQGRRNSPVIVMVDRDIQGLVTAMGVVYSGNFYVPVDGRSPLERLQSIIDTLQPPAIIYYNPQQLQLLQKTAYTGLLIPADEAAETPVDAPRLKAIRNGAIDTDPLYAIFTSGSTGTPKGVVISHRGAIDLAEWLVETFGFTSDDRLGNQTPFYFDGSVKDIMICLRTGARLNILPRKYFAFPKLLANALNDLQITSILWATSAIVLTGNSGVFEQIPPRYLRRVFFAGEAMPVPQLEMWRRQLPDVTFVNLYGPTEITVDCTYYVVDRHFTDGETVPIGRPCRNMGILLLGDDNCEVPVGETGEICVRGSGVALGYYNSPDKTHEAFVQNPLNTYYRDLIYRTGDLARYNQRGELEFVGRHDYQIKHQGNRIELGEIEAAVVGVPGVEVAACVYDHPRQQIVLYYVGTPDLDIINAITTKVPRYMYPSVIYHVERMPYSPNGKIDRHALLHQHEANINK